MRKLRTNVRRNIAILRRALEDVHRFSRLVSFMEDCGLPMVAMEYKARKIAAICLMAETTSKVIGGLSEFAPDQEQRITAMKLRSWAIQDKINDFAYPERPYYPLDIVFESKRHPLWEFFFKWKKRPADELIMTHGAELMQVVSDLFLDLDRAGKLTH